MSHYYFLTSALPPLELVTSPDISTDELYQLLEDNLSISDKKKWRIIRLYIDILNIRQLFRGDELDPRGSFSAKELEDVIKEEGYFPSYLYAFLEEYESVQDRLRNFSKVLSAFFIEETEKASGFLKKYLEFERDFHLVMVGFRSNKMHSELSYELQYEDPTTPIVAQMLAGKDSPEFDFPYEFAELGEMLTNKKCSPIEEYQLVLQYKFEKIQSMLEGSLFTVDVILGYLIQLMLIEDRFKLDQENGMKRIEEMIV